jgi:hypothetical protein
MELGATALKYHSTGESSCFCFLACLTSISQLHRLYKMEKRNVVNNEVGIGDKVNSSLSFFLTNHQPLGEWRYSSTHS